MLLYESVGSLLVLVLIYIRLIPICNSLRTCDHNLKIKVYANLYVPINTTFCVYTTSSVMLTSFFSDSHSFHFSDTSRNVGVKVKHNEADNETYLITFYIQNITRTSFKNYDIIVSDNITSITVEIQILAHVFRMCNSGTKDVIVYTEIFKSINTSFCVITTSSLLADFIFIDNDVDRLSDTSRNVGVQLNKHPMILTTSITFYITNVTNTSFKTYAIRIMDELENTLKLEVTVFKRDLLMKTETNELVSNVRNSLICHINDGTLLDLKLYKQYRVNYLMSTPNNTLNYTFKPLQCEDMGTYTCIVQLNREERKETQIHLNIKYCPPVLCENQVFNETHQVQIGATVTINYCVISPELFPNININNQIYGLNQATIRNIQVKSNMSQSQLYHNITVYVYHVLPGDDRLYTVLFNTTTNRQLQQQFYITILPDELHLCDNEAKHKFIFTEERQKLVLQTCISVLLHNELHRIYVTLNGTTSYHNKCMNNKCVLWSRQSASTTIYTIFIVIENVTSLDFGELNVTVGTQYNFSKICSEIHYTYNIFNNEKRLTESSTVSPSTTSQLILILTIATSLILFFPLISFIWIKLKTRKHFQQDESGYETVDPRNDLSALPNTYVNSPVSGPNYENTTSQSRNPILYSDNVNVNSASSSAIENTLASGLSQGSIHVYDELDSLHEYITVIDPDDFIREEMILHVPHQETDEAQDPLRNAYSSFVSNDQDQTNHYEQLDTSIKSCSVL